MGFLLQRSKDSFCRKLWTSLCLDGCFVMNGMHFNRNWCLLLPMLSPVEPRLHTGWGAFTRSLSGHVLLLTILFVFVGMVVIYVPAVARHHHQLLANRVSMAELAILPFTEAPGAQLSQSIRTELLERVGVRAIVLTGGGQHELIPVGQDPPRIDAVYNAGDTDIFEQARDALRSLLAPAGRIVRIDATSDLAESRGIFVVASEDPIRAELFAFSLRSLGLGIVIAAVASLLMFLTLYRMVVRPIKRVTEAMVAFRTDPEDPARILEPSRRGDEIGIAERELATMQREIYGFLQQKSRLALLGTAAAKIQHDVRNILTSAQLASDSIASSQDPAIRHVTPRLVDALDRAVALATNTLQYGKADEKPPVRRRVLLAPVIAEVKESTIPESGDVQFESRVPANLEIDADPAQLFRILLNLVKNAREALEALPANARAQGKCLTVSAERQGDCVSILVSDNGPGVPPKIRERLFLPFAGTARHGSTGLGLAIARELAKAHGGGLHLVASDATGTEFRVTIPDRKTLQGRVVAAPPPGETAKAAGASPR
jgi:signal transduction histidine kinase